MTAPSPVGPAGPLGGLRVVVTRAAHQAGPTAEAFEAAGARVPLLPLLEVVPPDDPGPFEAALADLAAFDWIAFTSSNGVEAVFGRVGEVPEGPKIASVGGATSDALRAHGIEPDLEAEASRAEGLAAALAPLLSSGGARAARVLLPQAADARPTLEDELRAAGGAPLRVDAYAKQVPPGAAARATEIFGDRAGGRLGWVTFTSPSIARAFSQLGAALFPDDWPVLRRGLFAVSIGPVTSRALRDLGVEPAAEAAEPSDDGMVAAVVAAVADRDLGRA